MTSTRFLLAVTTAVALAILTAAHRPVQVTAAPRDQGAPSSGADQVDLAVTVYNSNLALVRDVREFAIRPGESDLSFVDIAATVNPATVHFRSLTDPSTLSVLEQNYEYDLLEPDKLLRKYVGREVTLVRTRTENGTTREEDVKATLVSYNTAPIWKIGNEYVTGLGADHLKFPELPSNLFSRPTLIWTLSNRGGSKHRVEASYLAGGLSWNADYVLTVGRNDKAADLDGWVTLTNRSGTGFKDTKLQLVAGQLNRVQPAAQKVAMEAVAVARAAAPAMVQEAFSEYHLYSLGRRTTVANNETKQLAMLNGTGVPVEKRYVVNGQQFYYRNHQRPGSPIRDDVETFYRFRNDEKSALGVPMPAGVIRVYQGDSKGGLHFIGEDRIDHTPKDETIDLKIGNAFDVVCERRQIDYEKISESVYEVEFEIVLRNHKETPITVQVNEPVGGTWRMLRSSHHWEKSDAWAASFTVPVTAGGSAALKYRVRVTY
ncbi:MAG: hypothetical protein Q7U41_02435 [Microbacterium sp.]|nr:hypothetical protein [Microbacterium sp.]